MSEERVPSIKLTVKDMGETFELDFCRDSVTFAEDREFVLEDVFKYPVRKVPEFFWYAFRMHHKNISRSQTNSILTKMGGLSPKFLERLGLLYQQAQMANNLQEDEDLEKNGYVTVEL